MSLQTPQQKLDKLVKDFTSSSRKMRSRGLQIGELLSKHTELKLDTRGLMTSVGYGANTLTRLHRRLQESIEAEDEATFRRFVRSAAVRTPT